MISFKRFLSEDSRFDPGVRAHLEGLGYKLLGQGIDQMAFLEPKTGKVLKIFGTAQRRNAKRFHGFTYDHLMFKTWVQYCGRNKSNEFLPRFDGWESFELNGEKYLQIRMERLTTLPLKLAMLLGELADDAASRGQSSQNKKDWEQRIGDEHEDVLNELVLLIGEDGFNKLWGTLVSLARIGRSNGYSNDLHEGNFMHRNDGTPVIVDPWVAR